MNVGSLFSGNQHSFAIRELTQEKGLTCAGNVGRLSCRDTIFLYTKGFTQNKGLRVAVNVGKALGTVPTAINTRAAALEVGISVKKMQSF